MGRRAFTSATLTAHFTHHFTHEILVNIHIWFHGVYATCLVEASVARGVDSAVVVCAQYAAGTWRQEADVLHAQTTVFSSAELTWRGRP